MRRSYLYFCWSGSITLLLFFILLPTSASAFGVSPATTEVYDILPGSRIQRVLMVSHTTVQVSSTFDMSVGGSGAQFIELSSKQVTVSANEQRTELPFTIVIPESVRSGTYSADISIIAHVPTQTTSTAAGLTMRQGVAASVVFSVTEEEVSAFSVRDTGFEAAESKKPVIFYYRIVNDGNMAAGPDRAIITLTPTGQNGEKREITVSGLPTVPPKQTEMIRTQIADELSAGRYAVQLSFFSGDTAISEEKDKQFLVVSPSNDVFSKVVTRFFVFKRFLLISLITATLIFIFYSYLSYRKRDV